MRRRHHVAGATLNTPVSSAEPEPDVSEGLEPDEAAARLAHNGPNELPEQTRTWWPVRLLRQFLEPMALLLIVAAGVAWVGLDEQLDGVAILAIVILNAAIGFFEEGKAARALDALRKMETPLARLRRGGRVIVVAAREIVAGDVVLITAGDRVPADLRLEHASSLEVDESILTGESLPTTKDPLAEVPAGSGLAEQRSMVFTGTLVTHGTGTGIAVATGPRTALGAIAEQLHGPTTSTPLQRELRSLTTRLGSIAVIVAAGVFGLFLLRRGLNPQALEQAFLSSVALAVAAVPEGLATVVTVGLALGVRRMAVRGAIVRRLPAVETLGSTTVILTDKTGTLTENRIELAEIAVAGLTPGSREDVPPLVADRVAEVGILCNDATLDPPSGDPIDLALLEAWRDDVGTLRRLHPRMAGVPFDAERKRMTTVHEDGDATLLVTKGAPETVLGLCTEQLDADGSSVKLDAADRTALHALADQMAGRGMRVLAFARRPLPGPWVSSQELTADVERALTLVGIVGLRDPVRAQASRVVDEARRAGVQIVMVTGDHPGTASAVAGEVGLLDHRAGPMTGAELRTHGIPDDPLTVGVYARLDPDQKLSLVHAVQAEGHVVAVTGDGVNDAPALQQADIGVAMGRSGSDVAREAADMVVTDDDLGTIVAAVREGRGIHDNIRKVVDYLVAGNLSEIGVVVLGLLLFPALGSPLSPIQLLWVNLLTDGLPALALGVDPPHPGLMDRPPRSRDSRLLTRQRISVLAGRGATITAAAIGALVVMRFAWEEPWHHARAGMFSVLVVAHLLYAFAVRAEGERSSLRATVRALAANRWLLLAVGLGIVLQILAVTWPAARPLFETVSLSSRDWVLVGALGLLPTLLILRLGPLRGDKLMDR